MEVTDVNEWVEKLEHQRKEKDIFFVMHQHQPMEQSHTLLDLIPADFLSLKLDWLRLETKH